MNAENIYRRTIYKESISKENWQQSQIAACAASRRKYSYLNKHSWKTAQYSLYSIFTEGCKMIPASLREAAEGRLDIYIRGENLCTDISKTSKRLEWFLCAEAEVLYSIWHSLSGKIGSI